jgi:hypothetical protein
MMQMDLHQLGALVWLSVDPQNGFSFELRGAEVSDI